VTETGQELERAGQNLAAQDELTIDQLLGQIQKVQQAMAEAMQEGEHYGVIPGTNKPTLLKPGAEKLCLLFRLDPEYELVELREDKHLTVTANCTLFHIPTGNRVASGMGSCSTKESKYAFRNAKPVCPDCGQEAIIKGKAEYGGGWVCWRRAEPVAGCGAKFDDGDARIESQPTGKIENPNLPDQYNTVLKMACKRALIAAVLNGTAASDIFTQDLDDKVAAPVPVPETLSLDTLGALLALLDDLAAYAPYYWDLEVVVQNASQRFGRQINALADLSEAEATQILQGALAWQEEHPAPIEGEVVSDPGSDSEPRADENL